MSQLVPHYIEVLEPYKAGKSIDEIKRLYGLAEVFKLASNENPLGVSPLAQKAIRESIAEAYLYPDPLAIALRTKLAAKFNIKLGNVIADGGSEAIIANIMRTFLCDDDEVITSEGTFIGFMVIAKSRGTKLNVVPMKSGYRFDLDRIANAITDKTKIIYLCNPNNPTGQIFTKREFDTFIGLVPERVIVILDEAYFEFAADAIEYPDSMNYRYDNVITLRTFSKIHGLAGLRVGYGFAHEKFIQHLLKVKLPFEPSLLAQRAAEASLADENFLTKTLRNNHDGYRFMTEGFERLGLKWFKSLANFVMIDFGTEEVVNDLFAFLLERGVIVRPLKAFGLPHCLRVSIGLPNENDRCLALMQAFVQTRVVT
jgi:histidinol-phosphate aminotransferase